MEENLHTKYTPFTYNDITLNKKPPITKQNLCIFFIIIGRVECIGRNGHVWIMGKLNSITIQAAFPLPHINEKFGVECNSNVPTSSNMAQIYLQWVMKEIDIKKTVLRAGMSGLYNFPCTPFYLSNALFRWSTVCHLAAIFRCLYFCSRFKCYARSDWVGVQQV